MLVEDSSLYTNLNIAVGISSLLEDMRNGSGDNKGSLAEFFSRPAISRG